MKIVLSLLFLVGLTVVAQARTWTSADGNSLEAEFLSATETHVTIRREVDGQRFTFDLSKLSQEDQDWVAGKQAGVEPSSVELPSPVAALVETRGSLLFEDNFDREDSEGIEELGEHWETNSKSRAQGEKQNDLVDGTLVMTISPKADHAISTKHKASEPFADVVVSLRMKIDSEGGLKLAYNDREDQTVHAGHINGVTMSTSKITLADEREGRFLLKYRNGKDDPEIMAEKLEKMKETERSFDLSLDPGAWHDVVTTHLGETLTVYIDGEEVGTHTSPGFGHATKRDFVFAVPKQATVDDLKIWKLAEGQ